MMWKPLFFPCFVLNSSMMIHQPYNFSQFENRTSSSRMHILFKVDLRQVWNPVIFWMLPGKAETKSSERFEQTSAKNWIGQLKLLGRGPTPIFFWLSPAACSYDTLTLQRTSVSFISLILFPVLVILQKFCHCHSRLQQRQSCSIFPCTL